MWTCKELIFAWAIEAGADKPPLALPLHKDPPAMLAVVVLVRGFDVGLAILRDSLLTGAPEAGSQVDCRRLEEGRCLLLRARVRENQPSLMAHLVHVELLIMSPSHLEGMWHLFRACHRLRLLWQTHHQVGVLLCHRDRP